MGSKNQHLLPFQSSGAIPATWASPKSVARYQHWRAELNRISNRHNARIHHALSPEMADTIAMLLAEPQFGADQLFATATALREARAEALLEDRRNLAGHLMSLITPLETEAAMRAREFHAA